MRDVGAGLAAAVTTLLLAAMLGALAGAGRFPFPKTVAPVTTFRCEPVGGFERCILVEADI
jgi:hypothetical protein